VRWTSLRALLALCLFETASASPADEHLQSGARFFHEERYAEALVEFKLALKFGAGTSTQYYIAASLQKLSRADESVEAFAAAIVSAPRERDTVSDYYYAMACYEARLYRRADRLFADVEKHAGPKIASLARKVRADLAPQLMAQPSWAAVNWYLEHGISLHKKGYRAVAIAYLLEGLTLALQRGDQEQAQEAVVWLREASNRLEPR